MQVNDFGPHKSRFGATARTSILLVAIVIVVIGLAGYFPDSGPRQTSDVGSLRQSVLPLAVMAVAGVFIVGSSVLAFTRRTKQRGLLPEHGLGRRTRQTLSRRNFFALVAVVIVAIGIGAVVGIVLPHGAEDSQTDTRSTATTSDQAGQPPPSIAPATTTLNHDQLVVLVVASGAMISITLGAAAVVFIRSIRRRTAEVRQAETAEIEAIVSRAATRMLEETVAPQRDPRSAIIACYRAMEQEFSSVPGLSPTASDTSTEVLARAVKHDVIEQHSATRLVSLFAEARFSTHLMTERHRSEAVSLLRGLLDRLTQKVAR